jgi:hypothetical protein
LDFLLLNLPRIHLLPLLSTPGLPTGLTQESENSSKLTSWIIDLRRNTKDISIIAVGFSISLFLSLFFGHHDWTSL